MLGMYHCINPIKNHKKYYHVLWDNNKQCYVCKYGRIGNSPQIKEYRKTKREMEALIRSKIKKGYNHIPGYETKIGNNNTLEYLLSLDTGLE